MYTLYTIDEGGEQMPRKPKQPCAYPGCPTLSEERYCERHRKLMEKNYEKYSRDPAVHKKYGRAWKRIRDNYVKTHPFCERCFANGILVPVEEVHHKVPISQGGTHDPSNLMSLCRSCHNKIHHEIGDR
jgi:5-methylcytosine-specific restriction protein A